MFLGRIAPIKGLLEAVISLGEAPYELDFDIYGPEEDAHYAQTCRKAAESASDQVTIRFAGPLDPKDVFDVMQGYDVLVVPSRSESFGHVIGEALAAGVPVAVQDVTPWTEHIRQGGGIVVTSPQGWAESLQRLADLGADERAATRTSAYDAYERWFAALPKEHLFQLINRAINNGA
jgi:glycosyltransferase involved in cell wall biosynthesis